MDKTDGQFLALATLGAVLLAWGQFGLIAAAVGRAEGAGVVGALAMVAVGAFVTLGAWVSWQKDRTAARD